MKNLNYIDLFTWEQGAFRRIHKEGFKPIAHVEMNEAASQTLKTRVAFIT